jgi:hypothetical protein
MRLDETMDKYLEALQKLHYNNDTITIWHYCCDVGMFGYLGYSFEKKTLLGKYYYNSFPIHFARTVAYQQEKSWWRF